MKINVSNHGLLINGEEVESIEFTHDFLMRKDKIIQPNKPEKMPLIIYNLKNGGKFKTLKDFTPFNPKECNGARNLIKKDILKQEAIKHLKNKKKRTKWDYNPNKSYELQIYELFGPEYVSAFWFIKHFFNIYDFDLLPKKEQKKIIKQKSNELADYVDGEVFKKLGTKTIHPKAITKVSGSDLK